MELASVHQKGHHRGASLDLRSSLAFNSTLHVRNFSAGSNAIDREVASEPTRQHSTGTPPFLEIRIPGLGGPARVSKTEIDHCGTSSIKPSESSSWNGHCSVQSAVSNVPVDVLPSNANQQHMRNLSLDSALQQQRQLQQLQQQHLPLFATQLNVGHLLQVSSQHKLMKIYIELDNNRETSGVSFMITNFVHQ